MREMGADLFIYLHLLNQQQNATNITDDLKLNKFDFFYKNFKIENGKILLGLTAVNHQKV